MKKIFLVLAILATGLYSLAQPAKETPTTTVDLPTTNFGNPQAVGNIIYDKSANTFYEILVGQPGTSSLSGLTIDVDYEVAGKDIAPLFLIDQIAPTNLADITVDGNYCVRNAPADLAAQGITGHTNGDILRRVGGVWTFLLSPVAGQTAALFENQERTRLFSDDPTAGDSPAFNPMPVTGEPFSVYAVLRDPTGTIAFDGTDYVVTAHAGGLISADISGAAVALGGTFPYFIDDNVNPERSGAYNLIINDAGGGTFTFRRDFNYRSSTSFVDGQQFFVGISGGTEAGNSYLIELDQQFIINTGSISILLGKISNVAIRSGWIDDGTVVRLDGVTDQVGIGTTTPNASAVLEIQSTTQGFLGPRMTNTERDAIISPATGLKIYSTTNNVHQFYNGTGWKKNVFTPANTLDVIGGVPFVIALGEIHASTEFIWDNVNKRLGIGTGTPNAELDVRGVGGVSVGGFPSGAMHVTSTSALVNSNAVITGHNLFGGNKQLWYLGSSSGSSDNITFLNRQTGSLSLGTIGSSVTLTSSGDIDLISGSGGVFKFDDNAGLFGLDASNQLEVGHGGSNAFINNTGAGNIELRWSGVNQAQFTPVGHLHFTSTVDQKHTLKFITNDNANATGLAYENSGGAFTGTIYRDDIGGNRADLIFAVGQNSDIDLLTDAIRLHGSVADEGKVEILQAFQISSGTPGLNKVLTSDATGLVTWVSPVEGQFSGLNNQTPTTTNPIVLTFEANEIPLEGLTHSITVNPGEFTATVSKTFTWQVAPQWQKLTASGTDTLDFFIQTDTGSGFITIINSNVKVIADSKSSNVIFLSASIPMLVGDKIRFMFRSSNPPNLQTVFFIAAGVVPGTPSQILNVFSGN